MINFQNRIFGRAGLILLAIAQVLLLASCSKVSDCASGAVKLSRDFEAGRFNQCKVQPGFQFELKLVPENRPINPSPWYAFRVDSELDTAIRVNLNYTDGFHRYLPKFSSDKINWQPLSDSQIEVAEDGRSATLRLDVRKGSQWVAAQPILDNANYDRWMSGLLQGAIAAQSEQAGESLEGRAINAITAGSAEAYAPRILLLGRQHPPEITGALAMRAFVERVFEGDALSRSFLEQFRVVVIPNMNPDGVANGNWRHNSGGTDLNRDWGPFEQQETRQVIRYLESRFGDAPVWGMLDFHSTKKNVLYTQADGQTIFSDFTRLWAERMNASPAPIKFEREATHKNNLATTKTYFFKRYQVPSITFELDDVAPPADIVPTARIAAETYMSLLLEHRGSLAAAGEQAETEAVSAQTE
ncbi:M14 family metallopeptidase [Biformimicrobium ophioploci]|uniref:M14-type cytosolic carboxypeptidase n=1 Tax=Biformimicrobium ophioploci TaxID=3036711 RepID=A0ABQ6LZZ7_9GAMM|nr:M14 family metallopeptidase [Microbulbifer sp. NKW57]GMG87670.1 M14-type cytosolic carboxypeptidase [Microbulbifer sp. NKW57]